MVMVCTQCLSLFSAALQHINVLQDFGRCLWNAEKEWMAGKGTH